MSVQYKIRDQHGLNYLTCATVGWVDLFTRQVYRDFVLESWRYCQKHKGFQVHAYTIMSNHWHLIASCRPPFLLVDVMRDWKAYTARQVIDYLLDTSNIESRRDWLLHLFGYHAYNKKHKQTYQVWQHDNHPIELYTEPVIAQKMNYIHDNAVEAGYVILPEQWLYSSAAYYAAIADDKFCDYQPLIEIAPIWEWFFDKE
jgi:REP element-mobilizing transposase RayT